ncbi:hypothetical protein U27_01415 [Candidatus Vecturithrix granuli]|uniref:Uncharacterized protein n=1 Tax=Vecturithrix granuli TaxID=1499967 RepID=A0A081CAA9_VECG1|nr:hypothetical protein U27_01415 [Candidatus Vecturithrix granuli]
MKTLIKPWKGLKHDYRYIAQDLFREGENPNKTLEGIKTPVRENAIIAFAVTVKTLIKPWKGLKPRFVGDDGPGHAL